MIVSDQAVILIPLFNMALHCISSKMSADCMGMMGLKTF